MEIKAAGQQPPQFATFATGSSFPESCHLIENSLRAGIGPIADWPLSAKQGEMLTA
jgi:hypothetical protein